MVIGLPNQIYVIARQNYPWALYLAKEEALLDLKFNQEEEPEIKWRMLSTKTDWSWCLDEQLTLW